MSRKFLLATPLSDALSEDGSATVAFLREGAPQSAKADRAFRFIYAVGEHALRFHFSEPLTRLGVGLVLRKGVDVALSLGLSGLKSPLRRVLSGMDDQQLRLVADEIEFRLYPDPHG